MPVILKTDKENGSFVRTTLQILTGNWVVEEVLSSEALFFLHGMSPKDFVYFAEIIGVPVVAAEAVSPYQLAIYKLSRTGGLLCDTQEFTHQHMYKLFGHANHSEEVLADCEHFLRTGEHLLKGINNFEYTVYLSGSQSVIMFKGEQENFKYNNQYGTYHFERSTLDTFPSFEGWIQDKITGSFYSLDGKFLFPDYAVYLKMGGRGRYEYYQAMEIQAAVTVNINALMRFRSRITPLA